jgi:hypothetical protein
VYIVAWITPLHLGGGIWTHNIESGTRGSVLFSKTEKVKVKKEGGGGATQSGFSKIKDIELKWIKGM